MRTLRKNLPLAIFIFSIFIHLFYYLSAHLTHTLDIFFEHVTRGQDFFQVPNGAYAFWRGGTLEGKLAPGVESYTSCCGVNFNVYHPLFTLLVGTPLQFLSPWTSFYIWVGTHLLVILIIAIFLLRKFKNHKYLYLAPSLYFFNFYHYYEIQHAQYHFLLLLFTILFLYEIQLKGDTCKAGFWYFLSLMVKPIGLLWILPLLFYKRFKTVIFGLGSYLLFSLPFLISGVGEYYFGNLFNAFKTKYPSYNIVALMHFIPINPNFFSVLSLAAVVLFLFYQLFKRPPIFLVIFLWISFQLIFYPYVYPYHYMIVAGLIPLGILFDVFPIKKAVMIPIFFLTIPPPIIVLRFFGAPAVLTAKQFSFIALWSVFWLTLLCVGVVFQRKVALK